jgi:undecaprenyl-diphosphatase
MTRRLLGALAVLAMGGTSVALLAPVRDGLTVDVYLALVAGTAWDHVADALLVPLGLLLAWAGWSARRQLPALLRVGWVGVGTGVAYGLSEALKVVVDEDRPCRAVLELAGCPPLGDWSYPSNHATLAAGLAVGIAMLRPRFALAALPLGVLIGLVRVVAGVHYPHDVLAGAALGAAVVVAGLLVLGQQPSLVRDHSRGRPVRDS